MGSEERKTTKGAGRPQAYHHGDLHHALIAAAEAELIEKGIEGFTLRGCAKRAGVSHAAPAHHFKDAAGLLTALAELGFRRFVETQRRRGGAASDDPKSRFAAAGLGYIEFATANPELFKLMFASKRADFSNPGLQDAASAAFNDLVQGVGAIRGRDPRTDEAAMIDVMAAWATVHGLANLLMSQHVTTLREMPAAERERVLEDIIRRAVP